MQTSIYWIRHGETSWNQARRIQGHQDIELTEAGLLQAERVAQRMSQYPLQAVFSSDLRRAYETAQRIASHFPYHVSVYQELRERHYGSWEGRTREELEQEFGAPEEGQSLFDRTYDSTYAKLHQIETLDAMKKRSVQKAEELATHYAGGQIAIVSHGGLINAFLHHISDGEWGTGTHKLGNTSVSLVRFDVAERSWTLEYVNDTSHLEEPSHT